MDVLISWGPWSKHLLLAPYWPPHGSFINSPDSICRSDDGKSNLNMSDGNFSVQLIDYERNVLLGVLMMKKAEVAIIIPHPWFSVLGKKNATSCNIVKQRMEEQDHTKFETAHFPRLVIQIYKNQTDSGIYVLYVSVRSYLL